MGVEVMGIMSSACPGESRKSDGDEDAFLLPSTVCVHVVRHGQVDNPGKVFYGRLPNFDLHPKGREQARQAGKYLAAHAVRAGRSMEIRASPMLRAQTTAK